MLRLLIVFFVPFVLLGCASKRHVTSNVTPSDTLSSFSDCVNLIEGDIIAGGVVEEIQKIDTNSAWREARIRIFWGFIPIWTRPEPSPGYIQVDVIVHFFQSNDVKWSKYAKFELGEIGLWFLRRNEKEKEEIYTAFSKRCPIIIEL